MDAVGLLRKYQKLDIDGTPLTLPRTAREYAALLGVHESYLSKCYDGQIPVGMKAMQGLRRAFPSAAPEIVNIVLAGPVEGLANVDTAQVERAAVA